MRCEEWEVPERGLSVPCAVSPHRRGAPRCMLDHPGQNTARMEELNLPVDYGRPTCFGAVNGGAELMNLFLNETRTMAIVVVNFFNPLPPYSAANSRNPLHRSGAGLTAGGNVWSKTLVAPSQCISILWLCKKTSEALVVLCPPAFTHCGSRD